MLWQSRPVGHDTPLLSIIYFIFNEIESKTGYPSRRNRDRRERRRSLFYGKGHLDFIRDKRIERQQARGDSE